VKTRPTVCHDCGGRLPELKPNHTGGVGYAWTMAGRRKVAICYPCCGERDRVAMSDPKVRNVVLYMVPSDAGLRATNWPGTLSLHAWRTRKGRVYDTYHVAGPDGRVWTGRQRNGETDGTCIRLRAMAR